MVLVSTALKLGNIKYLILMLEICIITVIVKGHVYLLEIPSMHKLVQHFQTLHRNEDICIYVNLKVYILPPLNLNSYQCSCKQCCLYAVCVCYSLINPCGYWTWGTSFAFVSNRNTLYNVMGVKTHLSVNLPQSVSISGAEIKLTLWAVTTYVLCCNLAPSMSALKMCIFSNIVMKWQDFCCGLGHTVYAVLFSKQVE